ncbi:MAG: hypothetical protein ACK2UY_13035 [Anaerolineae bacterium]
MTRRGASARRPARAAGWLAPALALAAAAGYAAFAWASGAGTFPLDDAWIHQTYARNLAESGQLAYVPGQPSAGSTSPAWSFLLSVGYLLRLDYRLWAFFLGGLSLAATAWFGQRLLRRLVPSLPGAALAVGLFCAVEWHLVWAAASGMETMLFTALSLALLDAFYVQIESLGAAVGTPGGVDPAGQGPASLQQEARFVRAIGLGLLGGAMILTRPEGLALAGLVLAGLFLFPRPSGWSQVRLRLLLAGTALAVLALALVPYLLFNLDTSGSLWPNTFYAKQTEYRSALGLLTRLWRVLSPTLVGAQVLLLPGFFFALYRLVRRRQWVAGLPLVWWAGFLLVYALRLPVSYQHGRYLMPTIPILLLYGTWGTAALLRPRSPQMPVRVLSRALPVAVALLALVFLVRGALAYRDDVAFIENEMVATARWLEQNTEPGDLLAVHDIGAVGYLVDRPLLDLAGLITPEVIPFMTDADRLVDWMLQEGADYAVFFPDFSATYDQLAQDPRMERVHCSGYAWTRAQEHENMCVYRVTGGG